jgi:chromosome condensin MukBEF MukE localization factor
MTFPEFSQEAFERLTKGRHLCSDDGAVFHDLNARQDEYTALYAAVGFKLICDPRGFAYLTGESDGTMARTMERSALFVFLYIDYLSDRGIGVEEGLFGGKWHALSELPFLEDPRRRALFADAGLDTSDDFQNMLRYMARLGFVAYNDADNAVQFATPVRRIIDVALSVVDQITTPVGSEDEPNE